MKKVLFIILASFLALAACNNDDKTSQEKDKQTSEKENKDKDKASKKNKTKKDTKTSNAKQEEQNQKSSSDNTENQPSTQSQSSQVNLGDIRDRSTLESVIYGNYSEMEKIQAYNSAVANGVIPQGNVMEGPASAAYQSSLRVESGAEKSVYDQSQSPVQDESSEDVNAEINNAQTEDEYVDALRKKYNGGLSSGEMQTKTAIEQGYYDGDDGPEVYQKIKEREADIEAGKYDQYKQ
ncbi:hypothetical protein CD149_12545 [Staphylococcus condimenti]|uniref:Uncharacterized protein n=2 Tax=Staphylococcus TaxID=1279 RepID=A0A143PBE6_9STAP|nr:hypothetical protein [Staphylococcus condimenti]AMY05418.1 hypothetical protein A4G25_05460 [Staphylococcus condimenti]PNZ56869.1 hypothetical protein CD149_12545 [Staphylococcus condimenti]QQS82778.1 hypothetical protein I6J05_00200 [Staphylococcus condimenti]QRP94789.1 hypothetical protein I6J35_08830 [Staphylococcus condimenti]RZI00815.1 hypothetical protein EIG99_10440 [Staphylococcus condimenti]